MKTSEEIYERGENRAKSGHYCADFRQDHVRSDDGEDEINIVKHRKRSHTRCGTGKNEESQINVTKTAAESGQHCTGIEQNHIHPVGAARTRQIHVNIVKAFKGDQIHSVKAVRTR